MRADAQRNRDAILRTAREVFAADGVLAPIDTIAVRAGVGNATLYRNFPTRDDLLGAVMQDEIADAARRADELAQADDPAAALTEWLVQLTWLLRIWHDLPYCIATAHTATAPAESAYDPLIAGTALLLERAGISTLTAAELFELVTTLSWGVDKFGDDYAAAERRVRLATAGVFAPPAVTAPHQP